MLVEEETKISGFLQIKLMSSIIQVRLIDSITYAAKIPLKLFNSQDLIDNSPL